MFLYALCEILSCELVVLVLLWFSVRSLVDYDTLCLVVVDHVTLYLPRYIFDTHVHYLCVSLCICDTHAWYASLTV